MAGTAEIIIPTQPEAFTLRPQFPMVIPKEIRGLELAGQLPGGEIAYYDANEPHTLRLVDRGTLKPVTKKGVEVRLNLLNFDKAPRRLAAVILNVPPRTPDNSYEEVIERFSKILKRTSKREEGIITKQYLGVIFIVEGKGEDQRVGWRKRQFRKMGLVVANRHEGSVIVRDNYIISFARRPMQRSPVDLTQGARSRYMVGPFIQEIEDLAERQGFTADTSGLRGEARRTLNPPRTIAELRDGSSGVIFVGEDSDGERIVVDRTGRSEFVTPSREALKEMAERARPNGTGRPEMHKPGDKVPTDIKCWDCPDGSFDDEYYEVAGRKRWLLRRRRICHGSHPDGYPREIEDGYVGYLNRLPSSMTRA
ncbi:MAG: hypothetical protein A2868_03870 [Candidatus Levybacteria bacterium RIFCSPHIGHO2_01_FULL_40_15b]|nr:MAG: hypothetical protein A2868_03870 [Candidatus Levybacteria bacterium RIFCSPHIGHO2_01_FULL_40_15b]